MLGLASKWIGLAIEHSGIRYIKLKNNKPGQIERKGYLPLRPGMIVENQIADVEDFRGELGEWIRQEGLKGHSVSLSIPPSQIIIRKLSIPSTNSKQVEQLVGLEVETSLHLPFENPVFDYLEIGKDEESTQLLVFAAPRRLIEIYTEILEDCGLKVRTVEISATALARLFTIDDRESFSETMLVHLDRNLLDLYLFHNGHPVFLRAMDLNDRFQSRAAEANTVERPDILSPEQLVEITAEISRMLSFYQYSLYEGANRISDIVVTGPAHSRGQFVAELTQALPDLKIRERGFERYPEEHEQASAFDESINEYRIALGAVLREKGGFSIDLLPREDRETRIFPYVAIGLMCLWVIGAVVLGFSYMQNKNEAKELAEGIQYAQDMGTILEKELASLAANQGTGESPQQVISMVKQFRADPVSVWDALDDALPEQAVIRDISYNQKAENSLIIDFVSMEDASAYLEKLKSLPFARSAAIHNIAHVSVDMDVLSAMSDLPNKVYEAKFVIHTGGTDAEAADPQETETEEGGSNGNVE